MFVRVRLSIVSRAPGHDLLHDDGHDEREEAEPAQDHERALLVRPLLVAALGERGKMN